MRDRRGKRQPSGGEETKKRQRWERRQTSVKTGRQPICKRQKKAMGREKETD